jgi:hypothetical protein
MKRYISLLGIAVCFHTMQSQDVSDAIRYSQDNLSGTARFRAMGGAFGSLGGDLSAINVNPASSAVFINNQIGGSLTSFNTKNDSDYFGKKTSDKRGSFDLSQAGGVFVFENGNVNSHWRKFSLAINYENTAHFDNRIYSRGYNPNNSGINYFLVKANGNRTDVLENGDYGNLSFNTQQGWLGYQAYLINPLTPTNNTLYDPNRVATGNFYQENEIVTTGYNGKISFNIATQYKDFLFLGLNLNSHFTDYIKSSSFYEDYLDSRDNDPRRGIQSFRFNNDLYTYGNGFSLQLGAIVKPIKEISLGLSFESPTWYTLNDELIQNINSECADCRDGNNNPITNITIDPNYTNIYAPYQLQTPSKITASLGIIFGKRGLLSFDYSNKNYTNSLFSPESDDYFKSLNQSITEVTRSSTSEYRLGGEYRIKQVSLRAGYRFQQSPYKDITTMGNLNSYSGGLGYNFGGSKLDLAFTTAQRQFNQPFFSQGLTDGATINSKNNTVTFTFTFEL